MMIQRNDTHGNVKVLPRIENAPNGGVIIRNNIQSMEYVNYNSTNGAIFQIQKEEYRQTYNLGFELRYYNSYQGFNHTRGGAAVFRPEKPHSQRYCGSRGPLRIYHFQHAVLSQFTLKYDCQQHGTNATVKIRLYQDDPVIEFDVRTDEISVRDGHGKDVTVNFFTPDIDNAGRFYTDSNGLEMQKRVRRDV